MRARKALVGCLTVGASIAALTAGTAGAAKPVTAVAGANCVTSGDGLQLSVEWSGKDPYGVMVDRNGGGGILGRSPLSREERAVNSVVFAIAGAESANWRGYGTTITFIDRKGRTLLTQAGPTCPA
jgi:hypothetical protein